MRRIVQVLSCVTLIGVAVVGSFWQPSRLSAQPPVATGPNRLKPFMQQKLDHAKTLLEGLALEDFAKIADSAQSLGLLSMESNWSTLTTEEYLKQSGDFQRTIAMIKSAAEEKNVDRATLGYMQLTVRCVECHKYVRNARVQESE